MGHSKRLKDLMLVVTKEMVPILLRSGYYATAFIWLLAH